jgi:hypothetical protein
MQSLPFALVAAPDAVCEEKSPTDEGDIDRDPYDENEKERHRAFLTSRRREFVNASQPRLCNRVAGLQLLGELVFNV